MRGFENVDGTAVAELDEDERAVIARLVADVGLLLGGESFGMERESVPVPDDIFAYLQSLESALSDPDDPAVLRLLPNAAPTDREVAEEFRRLTEPELRSMKVDRLRAIWVSLSQDGPEWEVPADEALATAAALSDIRLVIASRLGIDSDDDAAELHRDVERAHLALAGEDDLDLDRERVWLGMLYEALTWLQESLMNFLTGEDDD